MNALADVHWLRPLSAPANGDVALWVRLKRTAEGARFEVSSGDESASILHCEGQVLFDAMTGGDAGKGSDALSEARRSTPLTVSDLYARLERQGVLHGPAFRVVSELKRGDGVAVAHALSGLPSAAIRAA